MDNMFSSGFDTSNDFWKWISQSSMRFCYCFYYPLLAGRFPHLQWISSQMYLTSASTQPMVLAIEKDTLGNRAIRWSTWTKRYHECGSFSGSGCMYANWMVSHRIHQQKTPVLWSHQSTIPFIWIHHGDGFQQFQPSFVGDLHPQYGIGNICCCCVILSGRPQFCLTGQKNPQECTYRYHTYPQP